METNEILENQWETTGFPLRFAKSEFQNQWFSIGFKGFGAIGHHPRVPIEQNDRLAQETLIPEFYFQNWFARTLQNGAGLSGPI